MGNDRKKFVEEVIETVLDHKRLTKEQIDQLSGKDAKNLLRIFQDEIIKITSKNSSKFPSIPPSDSGVRNIINCTKIEANDSCKLPNEVVSRSSAPEIFVSASKDPKTQIPIEEFHAIQKTKDSFNSQYPLAMSDQKVARVTFPPSNSLTIEGLRKAFADQLEGGKQAVSTVKINSSLISDEFTEEDHERDTNPHYRPEAITLPVINVPEPKDEFTEDDHSRITLPNIDVPNGEYEKQFETSQALSKIDTFAINYKDKIETKQRALKRHERATKISPGLEAAKFFIWTIPNESFHFLKGIIYNNADRHHDEYLSLKIREIEEAEDKYQAVVRSAWLEAIYRLAKNDFEFAKLVNKTDDLADLLHNDRVQEDLKSIIWKAKTEHDKEVYKINNFYNSEGHQKILENYKKQSWYLRKRLATEEFLKKNANFLKNNINRFLNLVDDRKRKLKRSWKDLVFGMGEVKENIAALAYKTRKYFSDLNKKSKEKLKRAGKTTVAGLLAAGLAFGSALLLKSDMGDHNRIGKTDTSDLIPPLLPKKKLTGNTKETESKQLKKPSKITSFSQKTEPENTKLQKPAFGSTTDSVKESQKPAQESPQSVVYFRLSDLENGVEPVAIMPGEQDLDQGSKFKSAPIFKHYSYRAKTAAPKFKYNLENSREREIVQINNRAIELRKKIDQINATLQRRRLDKNANLQLNLEGKTRPLNYRAYLVNATYQLKWWFKNAENAKNLAASDMKLHYNAINKLNMAMDWVLYHSKYSNIN